MKEVVKRLLLLAAKRSFVVLDRLGDLVVGGEELRAVHVLGLDGLVAQVLAELLVGQSCSIQMSYSTKDFLLYHKKWLISRVAFPS